MKSILLNNKARYSLTISLPRQQINPQMNKTYIFGCSILESLQLKVYFLNANCLSQRYNNLVENSISCFKFAYLLSIPYTTLK